MYARPHLPKRLIATTLGIAFTLTTLSAIITPVRAAVDDPTAPAATAAAPAADANLALLTAVAHGDLAGAKAALDSGANPNAPGNEAFDQSPPLHLATYLGHRDIVALLLERGADIKRPGAGGYPVVDFVVMNHHAILRQTAATKQMEAQMDALFAQQSAALQQAAAAASQQQPRRSGGGLLGGLGGMLGGFFKGGLGNVAMAVATGGTSAIGQGLLKSLGANVGKQLLGKALGKSPLGNFAQAVLSGNPISGSTALEALGAGKPGALTDAAGWVNLVQSASKGDASAVAGLANLVPSAAAGGADKATWGRFLGAAGSGNVNEVRSMLQSGKIDGYLKQAQDSMKSAFDEVERDTQERSAKYVAAPEDPARDLALLQLLLDHGAEVDAKDPNVQATPLMFAAQQGRADIAQALIAKGANVNAKDGNDMNPLDWCDMSLARIAAQMSAATGGKDPNNAPENPVTAVLKKAGAKDE